jgi:hypothetical protein
MCRDERRLALLLLGVVAAGFLTTQLILFSVHRAPSWDESVYLSQVTRGVPAVFFAPSRARGITFLVAPVTLAGGSIAAVRLYLAIVSSVALGLAFLPWISVVGAGAPLGAFLFGSSWAGLFYGSEAMPNLWAALSGVAAVGVAVPILLDDDRRWRPVVAGALVLVMALFRPLDALAVAVPLLVALAVRGPRRVRSVGAVAAGLVGGWLVWLVEMSVRFGGPISALRQGGSTGHVGIGSAGYRIVQQLRLTDGPTLGPDFHPIPVVGVLWWTGLVALTLLALAARPRAPLVVAASAGAAAAALYLVFVEGLAPRFLLPGYAVLSITAGAGALALVRARMPIRLAGVAAIAAITALAVWQAGTARRIERQEVASRAGAWSVGIDLGRLAASRPCAFASTDAYPQLQLASGCVGHPTRGDVIAAAGRLEQQRVGGRVFLVELARAPVVPPGWTIVTFVVEPEGRRWAILESRI